MTSALLKSSTTKKNFQINDTAWKLLVWRTELDDDAHSVLSGLLAGDTVSAVAARLDKSPKTIGRWIDRWLDQLGVSSQSALLVVYATQFHERLAEDKRIPEILRVSVARNSPAKQSVRQEDSLANKPILEPQLTEPVPTHSIAGGERVIPRTRYQHLLNPLLWNDILEGADALPKCPDALAPRRAEYARISAAINLTLISQTPYEAMRTEDLNELIGTRPNIVLPLALSMRFLGTPMSAEVTDDELAYETDFGASSRLSWLRSWSARLAFQKTYDMPADLAGWTQLSYELRHKTQLDVRTHWAGPSIWYDGPLMGMCAWLFCGMTHKAHFSTASDAWMPVVRHIVTARVRKLEALRIKAPKLFDSLELI